LADTWAAVLDDLEARVRAAEGGDVAALAGWATPPQPLVLMTVAEQSRASDLLIRQRALEAVLRLDLARTAASLAGLRMARPANRWAVTSAPVYVDRSA
jgi:hypothetical protein